MPHSKNKQIIQEISRSFEVNSEKAMNDLVNTVGTL